MLQQIDINDPYVLNQIEMIGYPSMLVLMIIEGPIATILAAFAASLGFFNIYLVFVLSVLGDIIGDVILYTIGWSGGSRALSKAETLLKIKPTIIARIEKLFSQHGKKTIFAVKSTTGLCWITFIAAGTVRMKFEDFLIGSFLGGIIWSGTLSIVGYLFGYSFLAIHEYIRYAGFIIAFSAIFFYASVTFYKKKRSQQLLKNDRS